MPVTITQIAEDGKITLSSTASFLGFHESVEHLGLETGCIANGYAFEWLSSGNGVIVMLAPNLYTIVNYSPTNRPVRVLIRKIDFENNRIKADFVEKAPAGENPASKFADFVRTEFDVLTDPEAFAEANKPKKYKPAALPATNADLPPKENKEKEISPPSFEIHSTVSPFRILEGETIQFDHNLPHSKFDVGIEYGKLTSTHSEIAGVVDYLKFTTAGGLARYLYLIGRPMDEDKLKKILETLCRYSVLRRFKFTCPEDASSETTKTSSSFIYTRGNEKIFLKFVGKFFSFHYKTPTDGDISSYAKGRLALNNLLLGTLLHHKDAEVETLHRFDPCDGDTKILNSCYCVRCTDFGNSKCFLESCRRDYDNSLLEKLQRYDLRLSSEDSVNIILEDEDHMNTFAERVKELHLKYTVRMTYDIKCFEENAMTIPPYRPDGRTASPHKNPFEKLKGFPGLFSGLFGS